MPATRCAEVVRSTAGRVPFVHVISGGFDEIGAEGAALSEDLLAAAREVKTRVIGPNCIGVFSPVGRQAFQLNAPRDIGGVSIVSQSGGLSGDFINEHGERVVDYENINRARLKIDARKWLMSKLHPRRYGDRVAADVTVRRDMRELSDSELLQIVGRSGEPDPGREAEGEETCIERVS